MPAQQQTRALLREAKEPNARGYYETEVIIVGDKCEGRFPVDRLDLVLQALLKVREIIA